MIMIRNLFFTKQQNCTQVQIEVICRRQNKCNSKKKEICVGKGRKHSGKRRKCWLPAFSPFSTMFSKAYFSGSLKVGLVWQGVNDEWINVKETSTSCIYDPVVISIIMPCAIGYIFSYLVLIYYMNEIGKNAKAYNIEE